MNDPLTGNIDPEVREALEHWQTYRPTMYAELQASGKLLEMAIAAHEATVEEEYNLHMEFISQGYPSPTAFLMAQEVVRQRYIFLPAEEDVPVLRQSEQGLYSYNPEESETGSPGEAS